MDIYIKLFISYYNFTKQDIASSDLNISYCLYFICTSLDILIISLLKFINRKLK